MRKGLFLLIAVFGFLITHSQVKAQNNQQSEMQQAINELKTEIKKLENEIKKVEKTDPGEAASLKSELATLKNRLLMFEKTSKPATQPSKPAALKNQPVKPIPSPIVPVIVKQPFTVPSEAQAKDKLLWYKGKKINDTTLVTVKGLLVQYNKNNKKSSLVKIQPPKKSDPFDRMVQELIKVEQRKEEMADKFDKIKNGFMFYPELRNGLAFYDDLNERMAEVLKNTIELPEMILPVEEAGNTFPQASGRGPFTDFFAVDTVPGKNKNENYMEEMAKAMEQQLALARKLFNELPPVASFPAPPKHDLGMCSYCDPDLIKQQKKQDSLWLEEYYEKEQRIMQIVLGVERQRALLGAESGDMSLVGLIFKRGVAKAKILFDKYGNDVRHLKIVMQVILGLERDMQLLGLGEAENFNGMQLLVKGLDAYEKYLNEQMEVKNHDFVLNIASHLGYLRQKALLGVSDDQGADFEEMIGRVLKYNRFELSMETDFIIEKRDDNELDFKATGAMATKEKIYGMFVSDSCSYKMIPYNADFSNIKLEDISILFSVKSGIKTLKDENGKLVNYSYSGPETYALSFPDLKIDFCNINKPDTAWFLTFMEIEGIAGNTVNNFDNTHKSYKNDFLGMANLIFVTDGLQHSEQEFEKVGQDIFNTIGGFQNANTGGSKLEKLKTQYEGKQQMDNHRKGIQNLVNDKKSTMLFTANNRSTVLTDKFTDTKRKLEEDGVEITRGLIHFKVVHNPVQ